jgi:signal transduction histidine kinase
VAAVRGAATVGRPQEAAQASGAPAPAAALLTVLARALAVERAALLVEESPGGDLLAVAVHGRVRLQALRRGETPGDGPWTLTLPVGGERPGLLLLARRAGAALAPADRALAESLADAAARLVVQPEIDAELERTRELLARADRLSALGTLAAGVAHEIRNPLVSVRTFIQLLPERLSDVEFRTDFRDLALAEVERICALINDLLAFSRPAPAQREAADLGELVAQIARLLDAEARRRDVLVSCAGDPSLPTVIVDDAQVKQVLMNVVLNAIEACGPHGAVEISTRIDESPGQSWCIVDVADTGPGISAENLAHIFDPFFTTKDQGSGLGLYIAHRIVSEHGGRIVPTPRAEGGTVFSIHFRLDDADAGTA